MGRLMKVNWPGPITAGECQRVLDLMDLAGRLPVNRLSAKPQRSLCEIVDKVPGRSFH
jgi:hypothetical protein